MMPSSAHTGSEVPTIKYLDSTYDVEKLIGEGSYGHVYAAVHRKSAVTVAVKILTPFNHHGSCLQALREIELLRHFDHENIIALRDIPLPNTPALFREVCLVQDLMDTDLHTLIRATKLPLNYCQYFTYQILRGLKYVHSAGVIHRDLKPSNLLVNADCDLKIADFGLARPVHAEVVHDGRLTDYVATRYYRAPEVMINPARYGQAIDIWSTGCIIGEMFRGQPLFRGHSAAHQLDRIFDALGPPSSEDIAVLPSARSRQYLSRRRYREGHGLSILCPGCPVSAIHLMQSFLTFNPARRWTAKEGLKHQFVEEYHDPGDEPEALPLPLHICRNLSRAIGRAGPRDLKSLLWNSIRSEFPPSPKDSSDCE